MISRAYCNPIIGYTIPNSYRILSSDAPLLTWPSTVLVEEVAGPLSLNHVMKAFICQHRLRWRSLEVHLGCVRGSRELGYSNADRPWPRDKLAIKTRSAIPAYYKDAKATAGTTARMAGS